MNSRSDILFCSLFVVILFLPIGLTISGTSLTEPLEENRHRQAMPAWSDCKISQFDQCHKQFDGWFNDNYQPRDLLIKLQTQINYSIFSTSDKVHIGPDSWLFYRSVMDTEKIAAERAPQAQFDGFLTQLDALDRYLSGRGIQLVVLPMPLKNVLYPEYVPRSSPNLPENSRYQQLRQWLSGHESILTVDAFELLSERKKQARVFHKTDFHWNDPAGFLLTEQLINTLWRHQSGESTAIWGERLSIEERDYSGGQASFLPLLSAPREQGLFLGAAAVQGKGVTQSGKPGDLWSYVYDGSTEPRAVLGGVVVAGDSFFDAMQRSGFNHYFSSVHRSNHSAEHIGEVYANIPEGTRYLVLEFIEVSIFQYLYHGLSVPET